MKGDSLIKKRVGVGERLWDELVGVGTKGYGVGGTQAKAGGVKGYGDKPGEAGKGYGGQAVVGRSG